MNVKKNSNTLFSQKDLTSGPVFSSMFFFALPMILGNLLQQGYNIVDTWVVGHYVGSNALAAVGSAFTLMTFLTSLLAITIAIFLTAISLFGTDIIIIWMNIPEEIIDLTREYLTLIFCGIPAIALYNYFGAYLKAIGNSVLPLIFLGISTILNIILDIVFVAVFQQGTFGAAVATIISQYISGIGIGIYVLIKNKRLRNALFHFKIKKSSLKEITNYSLLTCVQQSVMNLGILMVQGLVNSFGTSVMAAFAAAVKVDSFTYMPAQEYGNAFSTFIAQNVGLPKASVMVYCLLFYIVLSPPLSYGS